MREWIDCDTGSYEYSEHGDTQIWLQVANAMDGGFLIMSLQQALELGAQLQALARSMEANNESLQAP